MEHPGESLPGWVRGNYGDYPYAKLETELGRFTATWYTGDTFNDRAYVTFNEYYFCSITRERQTGPAKRVGLFLADEIVGQCLLFDTTR